MQTQNLKAGLHFRSYLRNELKERCRNNPSYSLRSFARSLDLPVSSLSSVMSGKIPVTMGFIERVSEKLELNSEQIKDFLIALLSEKSTQTKEQKDLEFIDEDKLSVIQEWYHYAILNLMRVKSFKMEPSWISRRLGITLPEAQTAIEKLQRVGLLKQDGEKWVDSSSLYTTHSNTKKFSKAARENQKQLFKKACESIEKDEFADRLHSGSTIAIKKSELDAAKKVVGDFRRQFIAQFDQDQNADDVYHLAVALFSLSK